MITESSRDDKLLVGSRGARPCACAHGNDVPRGNSAVAADIVMIRAGQVRGGAGLMLMRRHYVTCLSGYSQVEKKYRMKRTQTAGEKKKLSKDI